MAAVNHPIKHAKNNSQCEDAEEVQIHKPKTHHVEIYQNTTERIANFALKDLEKWDFLLFRRWSSFLYLLISSYDMSSLEPNTFLELLKVSIVLELHLII